jgi:CheY-like chemotaxis protein
MMVEDDASIRHIAEITLRMVGKWHVILCPSVQDALAALETEVPDVILLDVMMPHLDGITAFPLFQSKTNGKTPIIMMTAKVMKHELGGYLDLGAAGVISKPFEPIALPGQIQSIANSYEKLHAASVCV